MLCITGILLILTSCSTPTTKNPADVTNAPAVLEASVLPVIPAVEEQMDYIVKERNPNPEPEWMKDFAKWKRENEGHGQSYFLGESGDVNDRISGCDYAALVAKKKIAQQQAELVTNKIAGNKQGRLAIDPNNSNDPGLKRAFEEKLAGKSIGFLSGVKEYATFWELRDYSKSNGHKRVFNCAILVVISDKDLLQVAQRTNKKGMDIVEDSEAKEGVKESLKDIDKEFEARNSASN
jgi:hypothetical protein